MFSPLVGSGRTHAYRSRGPDIARGASDGDAVHPVDDLPRVGLGVPTREGPLVERDRHRPALAGLQEDLLEAAELARRLARGRRLLHVDLRDLGAGDTPGVLQG